MIGAQIVAQNMHNRTQRDDLLDASAQKLQQMASGDITPEKARAVATEFESLFISQMLEHMMSGDSLGESMFGSAETDDIYKGMMVDQYSKAITRAGGIGIAQHIERSLLERSQTQAELLKTQEVL